jgi:hypothetical protein
MPLDVEEFVASSAVDPALDERVDACELVVSRRLRPAMVARRSLTETLGFEQVEG